MSSLEQEAKIGFQQGISAVTADMIVEIFNKHFGKKIPKHIKQMEIVNDIETLVVPLIVFFYASLCLENKKNINKKIKDISLLAFRAKVQDLTKSLWHNINSLFRDIHNKSLS